MHVLYVMLMWISTHQIMYTVYPMYVVDLLSAGLLILFCIPKPVAILIPPTLPPAPSLSVLIHRPSPLLPYAPSSLLPPFIPAQVFRAPQVALHVNHTFRFGSPTTAYTGPIIHCLPPCPFHPSSVLQTSVLLIPSAFYTHPAPH